MFLVTGMCGVTDAPGYRHMSGRHCVWSQACLVVAVLGHRCVSDHDEVHMP